MANWFQDTRRPRLRLAGGGNLGNVHGADGRCQTYAHAAQDAVAVKCHQQPLGGGSLLEEEELRVVGTQGAQEEEDTGHKEGTLSAQALGQPSGQQGSDDAADQGAGGGEAMPAVRIREVRSALEKGLEALLRTGYDGGVVTEQQTAYDGNQDYTDEVQRVAVVLVVIHITWRTGSGTFRRVPACRRRLRVLRSSWHIRRGLPGKPCPLRTSCPGRCRRKRNAP